MNKIRVQSGIRVEVNDEGEFIIINIDDQNFISRFYGIIEKLEDVKKKVNSHKSKDTRENLEFYIEQIKEIMVSIDELFGEESCRKIFGDIVPSPVLIADFFEQITPVVEQYAKKRRAAISQKYGRGRKVSQTAR